jgi:hypothetical protein
LITGVPKFELTSILELGPSGNLDSLRRTRDSPEVLEWLNVSVGSVDRVLEFLMEIEVDGEKHVCTYWEANPGMARDNKKKNWHCFVIFVMFCKFL